LIELLRRILDETGVERLRISSIEPMDVTEELIALFGSSARMAQHFHMPLQSGCDRVLAAMHRWYRAEHYARRMELIRERLPDAGIGADVIAGFPGETDAEHAETVAFIGRLPFSYLHVFSFSQRPGTRAAELANQVAASVVKQRAREVRALGEEKAREFQRSQVGRELRVLTLRDERGSAETTPALSSNYLRVAVRGKFAANEWLDVMISERDEGVLGEPVTFVSVGAV
jgi:threonylcarbamoyladenosine tRNA methylthiotransferase MtaB